MYKEDKCFYCKRFAIMEVEETPIKFDKHLLCGYCNSTIIGFDVALNNRYNESHAREELLEHMKRSSP